MAEHSFKLITVTQELENGTFLGEALYFPEISRLAGKRSAVHAALAACARAVVAKAEAIDVHRRHAPDEDPVTEAISIELAPPRGSIQLGSPIALDFHYVRWRHGNHHHLAFVPALELQVLAHDAAELESTLRSEIRTALIRHHAHTKLDILARCQRAIDVRTAILTVVTTRVPPRQRHRDREKPKAAQSVLTDVATMLPETRLGPAYEVDDLVSRLAKPIAAKVPSSVLLVGPSGVGKTALVNALSRARAAHGLGDTAFWSTSGSRLVAGMSGFGMWQQRCRELCEEAERTRAVIHFGDLIELMEVGRSENQSQGIASFLRSYLDRGRVVAIAECTPEQLTIASREDPHLVQVFQRLDIDEGTEARCRAIIDEAAKTLSQASGRAIGADALATVDRLHRRYATYSAYPGRPLAFLDRLMRLTEGTGPVTPAAVTAAFSQETGLPRFMLDDGTPLDLEGTQAWFHQRVVGQEEAVRRVVDVIATAKVGLARPRRPIASLLFIGPTGVGKTEMAKALAERLFGDPDRLTRFDMSEYADPIAVERLTGGRFGKEGLLTAKLRDRPFSVVLLDELEKAHASFFDLMLQVIGEARLTDGGGRVADFSNAVVIMTSNLGAEAVLKESLGFAGPDRAATLRERFTQEVSRFFRPELVNRIDRIVAFSPLDRGTLATIASHQVAAIASRDGMVRRGVQLEIPDDVTAYLAERGHDPRFGARPLRRAIERELLAPLATELNQFGRDVPLTATASLDSDGIKITAKGGLDDKRVHEQRAAGVDVATAATALRREIRAADRCPPIRQLRDDVFRLDRLRENLVKRWRKGHKTTTREQAQLDSLPALRSLRDRLAEDLAEACAIEEDGLTALYSEGALDRDQRIAKVDSLRGRWRSHVLDLMSIDQTSPGRVPLLVCGKSPAVQLLCGAYLALAEAGGNERKISAVLRKRVKGDWTLDKIEVDEVDEIDIEDAAHIGVLIDVTAQHAQLRFGGERGTHRFYSRGKQHDCLVLTADCAPDDLEPPAALVFGRHYGWPALRRTYDLDRRVVRGAAEGDDRRFAGRAFHTALESSIERALAIAVEEFISP